MAKSFKGALPEDLRHQELTVGSDRSFGFVFTVFFALVALARPGFLQKGLDLVGLEHVPIRYVAAGLSATFLVIALVIPRILHPLNVAWMKLGFLMGMIVSPIVLGILFFLAVTPMGIFLRLTGKDLLRLKLDKSAASYWIARTPPGPAPDTMRNQF